MFLPLHVHPFFFFVLGLIVAIGIAGQDALGFLVPIISVVLGLGAALASRYRLISLVVFVFLGGMFIGWGRLNWYTFFYKKASQEVIAASALKALTLTITGVEHRSDVRYPYMISSTLEKIGNTRPSWARNYGIQLYIGTRPSCLVGDTIIVPALKISLPANPIHENWYARSDVIATGFCPRLKYDLLNRPIYHLGRWLQKKRNFLWMRLRHSLSKQTYTLMASLFGGSKDIDKIHMRDIKELFKRWGISHQLARSGLHVALFLLFWGMLLRLLPLPLAVRLITLLLLLLTYALLTWPSVSFMRALSMGTIATILRLFGKQVNSLHILSLVACGTLLLNPLHLFFIDFQLSFGFSFILLWLAHLDYIEKRL